RRILAYPNILHGSQTAADDDHVFAFVHLLDGIESGIGADEHLAGWQSGHKTPERTRIHIDFDAMLAKNTGVARSIITQHERAASGDDHFDGLQIRRRVGGGDKSSQEKNQRAEPA